MARVTVKNLTKKFGNTIAIDNVSFDAYDHEFLVLLGPSGSGKTTMLRCIAGLETPDSGEIYIDEKMVNDLPPKDRDVAMVFQNYALYPHMTVYDNIAFPLKIRKISKEEINKKVHEVAELLHITHLLNRKPKELSGGEQQRVALGRAIIRTPKVFLMDEPLSNLDAKLRVYMRAELKKLQKELGITTIYVTHDQIEAMTMADRVAVFDKGKIKQIAVPTELYEKPRNLFVAGFIGSPSMNFIDVSLVEENNLLYLLSSDFKIRIPNEISNIVKNNIKTSEIVLGVRPENIEVYDNYIDNSIKSSVYIVEPMGSEFIINVKMGESLWKIKYSGDKLFKPGDTIYLKLNMNKIHLFNKKTEESIL